MMEQARLGALSIFVSYFLLIIFLSCLILNSLRGLSGQKHKVLVFTGLTLGSFAHTWFYMFEFMHWSFVNYESQASVISESFADRIVDWLLNTELFEQAWAAVSFGKMNWWWSEKLCLFTVGFWTAFLYFQGKRYHVKHTWAYMILGQVVAISVASNLFYLAIVLSPTYNSKPKSYQQRSVPPILWASTSIALASVARSPYTAIDGRGFLLNLLGMHAAIVLPLLFTGPTQGSISQKTLFTTFTVASVLMRLRTYYVAWTDPEWQGVWTTLHSHPAQSSIGYDVLWTSASYVIWKLLGEVGNSPSDIFALFIPVLSVGVVASYNALEKGL